MQNIYYLSRCAYTSAEWLHEKHTHSQLLESSQILSTAIQFMLAECDNSLIHPNDPSDDHAAIDWCMESVWHFEWLLRHYECLGNKYARIFNRHSISHHRLLSNLRTYYWLFQDNGWKDPPLIMPAKYHRNTTEESYRAYYLGEKLKGRCYFKINPPFWVDRLLVISARLDLSEMDQDKESP